ncbi:NifU family protein [Erysipelotrichaceae bacterium OttesenSCG-928-M19]|nr:NifU family protein [Erysipelotrichaceae bacterium OttesenSCG-928-M19]
MQTIEEKIKEFTETVRPYLQRDGGDFEFVKFEDGIVFVKMLGACSGCSSSSTTIDYIEDMMCEEIPGVISVKEI